MLNVWIAMHFSPSVGVLFNLCSLAHIWWPVILHINYMIKCESDWTCRRPQSSICLLAQDLCEEHRPVNNYGHFFNPAYLELFTTWTSSNSPKISPTSSYLFLLHTFIERILKCTNATTDESIPCNNKLHNLATLANSTLETIFSRNRFCLNCQRIFRGKYKGGRGYWSNIWKSCLCQLHTWLWPDV